MKRCPQCEFIYEDEQSLCDMDGILLVFDATPVPNLSALATPAKSPSVTHHSRGRLVTMLAALVLATVLYLVYFVSTQQPSSRNSYSPAGISVPSTSKPVAPTPNNSSGIAPVSSTAPSGPAPERAEAEKVEKPAVTSPSGEEVNTKVEKEKEEATTPSTSDPEAKKEKAKPKAQSTTVPVKSQSPARAHPSDESKITSFFKKTGRLLKKPFKR